MALLANSCRSFMASGTMRTSGSRQPVLRVYASQASAAKQFVDDNIKNNKVLVFSKSYCPYCAKAKAALGSILPQEKFTVHEIENRPDCDDVQDALLAITGGRSVPRVFIDGKFIGGGDDTARLAQSGELKTMLAAAGVL